MLAGDYLYITQPEGLRALCKVDPRIETRLWRSMGTSFHPKAYLFDHDNGEGLLIVGSSNFSFTALKTGYEWNLAMNAEAEPYTFQMALDRIHAELLPRDNLAGVVDEFHHAAAKTYMPVIEHFQPKFLLGVTATPAGAISILWGIRRHGLFVDSLDRHEV
ncbi:DEAD/DEAH box helicase family protein [Paenibacillus sp. FSL M7-0656]|uniref:DEAD/DEAH box helicase family protein n=1 Tax=Paenibacillus sp. FSL M7-0656 TaxID=2921534 RepID=UPI0030FA41B4